MATMEDIARALGISKGTVSKALSGARDVSQSTRKQVLEKAVELGYQRIARSDEAPRIAIFITNMAYRKPSDFGYDIVTGFRKAAEPAGFKVEIVPITKEFQASTPYDQYMVRRNYRGALCLGISLLDPWLKEFESCRTPTVLYDNRLSGNPNVTYLAVDNEEGMALAVRRLKELGHRRIGYLSSALEAYVYRQRYQAFLRSMQASGLPADETVCGAAFHASDCLSNHLPRLLKAGCTAIVCSHDLLAHSVIVHCTELGLAIPGDISVIGFDDIPLCRYTDPPLTTIRQDRTDLGKSAFFALSSHLNHVSLSTFLLHPQLVDRASCGAPPEKPADAAP